MNKITLYVLLAVTLLTITLSGCSWQTAKEGTVVVKTKYDRFDRIIRPQDGGINDSGEWSVDYYEVPLSTVTHSVVVTGTSKDNARLKLPINIAYTPLDSVSSDKDVLMWWLGEYGLTTEARTNKLNGMITNQAQEMGSTGINQYDAYALLANQVGVRDFVANNLAPFMEKELKLRLVSVTIGGAPDFDDDRIETAGAAVVAAKKKEEEETALKKASEIAFQRREIENKVLENPKAMQLEIMRLDVQKAQALGQLKGTLIMGGNSPNLLIQPRTGE